MRSIAIFLAVVGCTTNNTLPTETCTQAVCPLGGHTYKFCSTKGATSCHYVGSDNKSFNCKSCSDCMMAATQIANWCSTGSVSMGGTTAGTMTTGGTTTSGSTTGGSTLPLHGCNTLLMCYIECNRSNPTDSCFTDCDAGATDHAIDLINTFGMCIDDNCFTAINVDSGVPYCTNATIDSPPCDECYNRILGSNGICVSSQTACTNDQP